MISDLIDWWAACDARRVAERQTHAPAERAAPFDDDAFARQLDHAIDAREYLRDDDTMRLAVAEARRHYAESGQLLNPTHAFTYAQRAEIDRREGRPGVVPEPPYVAEIAHERAAGEQVRPAGEPGTERESDDDELER